MHMFKALKDHLVPHKGNNHSPKLFAAEVVGELLLIIMLFQVVFVAHTAMVKNSDFLAAVLPTVLVSMTNADRVGAGVSELQSDALLAKAAQAKADDMASKGYFAHRDPDGRDPWYWFDKVGYVYSYAGENLAIDFSESVEVEEAWMNSPAHKANIMKGKFTKVGIGVSKGMYKGKETTFVVQFFAKPAAIVPAPVIVKEPELAEKPIKVVIIEPIIESTELEEEVLVSELSVVTQVAKQERQIQDEPVVLGVAFEPILEEADATVVFVNTDSVIGLEKFDGVKASFAEFVTSPSEWYMPLLIILFTVFGVVLVASLFVHMSKPEIKNGVEGIAMAMFVFVLLAGLVHFNFGTGDSSALVPSDGQYAAASVAFEDGFYFQ